MDFDNKDQLMFSYSIQYLQRFINTFQVRTPVHMYEYVTKVITSCIIAVIIVIGRLYPTPHTTFETLPLTYLSGVFFQEIFCVSSIVLGGTPKLH